ncbi:PPOX class F420-dependent oxidoreductase [Candidatus Bathyarchaeota archaeon]|nr:MAG: PPOX class F420-dependent oxidoreductase [Candidatus Bathyarchaeota archaeon]
METRNTTQPAGVDPPTAKLADLAAEQYLVIETYRKNGDPVRTPVWFVEHQGIIYVRTNRDTGKVKRIRRNPHVRIAPSTARGIPKSDWIEAEAIIIASEGEAKAAFSLLKTKYGIQYRLIRFIHWLQTRKDRSVALRIRI